LKASFWGLCFFSRITGNFIPTMISSRILAFSSSRTAGGGYLESAVSSIELFLGEKGLNIAFIPFASVDNDYEKYLGMVKEGLKNLPHEIKLAVPEYAISVIRDCDAIMVGGGNTFKLLHDIYKFGLHAEIQEKVASGTPYIGWSAGSNITCPSIATTNDMPIIEPQSFDALKLLPFQINPHYLNQQMPGHHGETRDQRLIEFITINPAVPVIGLPEGTALWKDGTKLTFKGDRPGVLFKTSPVSNIPVRHEIEVDADLSWLL
jgi:dipeptidase E